jgi:superfamily II DNA or RNA helicase
MSARSIPILFLKSFPDHKGRPGQRGGSLPKSSSEIDGDKSHGARLPSSADISSLKEARQYWLAHFGGKTCRSTIHRKSGESVVDVYFDPDNTHAYTEKKDRQNPGAGRQFSVRRAVLMSRILETIERPTVTLESKGKTDLFFEKVEANTHQCVALRWSDARGRYEFASAHIWTDEELKQARRPPERGGLRGAPIRGKRKSPMQKAIGPCSTVAVLESSDSGILEDYPGDARCGGRSRHDESLFFVADLVKALYPDQEWTTVDVLQPITLVFPNGHSYTLQAGEYSFADNLLIKALEPGQRWITVRPHGDDSKGIPVLVQEHKPGSGVFSVVAGAGGRLNYLKLRGIRPESSYKEQARERQTQKRLEAKEQKKRDKENGLTENKQAAKAAVRSQKLQKQQDFIKTVADAMGWQDHEFDESKHAHLSDAAKNKARDQHHRELLKRAHEAVNLQRDRLVSDHEARDEAGLGGVPLTTEDADKLSVADLDPVKPPSGGLGFSTDYTARAEAAGADEQAVKTEAAQVKAAREADKTEAQKAGAEKRKETAEAIKEELETVRDKPDTEVKAKLIDAKQAVALLKAQKALKLAEKQASKAEKDIDKSDRIKTYNLEVGGEDPDLDTKVAEDLENNLRTMRTRAFLSETAGKDDRLTRHVGAGAFNSINALALAAGGDALVDRSVVDVLGIAGAAQVLARRLHNDLDPREMERITEGFANFHVNHYMDTAQAALDQAKELQQEAKGIELGEAGDGHDLAAGKELMRKRLDALAESDKILGTALGEMEANAALVMALRQGRTDKPFEVPLGGMGDEDAIRQARAIGLKPGDYQIDKINGVQVLTVTPDGLDRLAKPVDREDLQRVRRNLDIIEGKQDEDNWLPLGVANRPDLGMPDLKPGVAPQLAEAFRPGDNLEQSLRDYIGGRTADGDTPADILVDIQSQTFYDQAGADRYAEYMAALDKVAPLKDEKGKPRRAEALTPEFQKMADEFTQSRYGAKLSPLHRQQFAIDEKSVDALHRALSAEPSGVAAYKPIGELTNQDQRALREFFYKNVAKEDPEAESLRLRLERVEKEEPEKEVEDMFGEMSENPDWREWKARRDTIAEQVNAASLTWDKYTKLMRGNTNAYAALQDLIRSKVSREFADNYNRLSPTSPLKVGREVIRNNLNHLDAVDPQARDARLEKERALIDSLRNREGGKYAEGSVSDKLDAARERQEAFGQAQMGLFGGDDDLFGDDGKKVEEKPLGTDERHTLGHAAEGQIARMMEIVGRNFKPGQPVKLWQPSMNGSGIARQRAVKLIDANKRVMLAAGVGSGKTAIGLGAFTHLQQQGKAKRGIFLVPSTVQGQFAGEALRYLDPNANGGKGFNWHIEPGASRNERIKSYKNQDHHFGVYTHAAFRDDMLHLGAKQAGITESEMSDRLSKMIPKARQDWIKSVMDKEGINYDYLMVDEGHDLLNRQGKENSAMANVIDSLSYQTPYYVNATAEGGFKNDVSEVFDTLAKMDPDRYTDRAAFMRRYGPNTESAKEGLRRELARYFYPSNVDPGVKADQRTETIPLSEVQKTELKNIDRLVAKARIARMEGRVDLDSLRSLSPSSFDGVPKEQHEIVGKSLNSGLGMLKAAAQKRIIDDHPQSAKLDWISRHASDRRGKPGVVFAHSLEAVKNIATRLESEGHRVVTLTGADSAKEKDKKRLAFNPESGDASADILIASDAGSVGLNLQSGRWLANYDTPSTAKTWRQRIGRIHRTGQHNDVEILDAIGDHPTEHAARDRLKKKDQMRQLVTSPLESLDETGLAFYLRRRQENDN